MKGDFLFIDYEIMMNENVKIGMYAPEFEAESIMGDEIEKYYI